MVKVAVIGLGQKGWLGWIEGFYPQELTHVGSILKTDGIELIAVCDISKEITDKFKEWWNPSEEPRCPLTPAMYNDYQEMMSFSKPEAVIICTPPETHKSIARNVVRFDSVKVVLLEKPVATTIKDATKVYETYLDFGIPCIVNHTRRWHPAWRAAKRFIKKLGGAMDMIGVCNGDPLDAGVHMADTFRMLDPNAEGHYINMYKALEGKYQPYLLFELIAYCYEGVVSVGDNGCTVAMGKSVKSLKYTNLKDLDFGDYLELFDYNEANIKAQLACEAELRDLATGKRKKPTCMIEDGLAAMRMLDSWGCVEDK